MKEYKKFHMVVGEIPATVEAMQLKHYNALVAPAPEKVEEVLPERTASVVFEGFQGKQGKPEVVMADQPLSVASLIAGHLNRAYSFGFARGRDFSKLAILQGLGFNDPLVDGE
jgi:hypothetical protein